MRRCLFLALAFLLLFPPPVTRAQDPLPLEQVILQQHLTQAELQRNLALIKQEEDRLQSELARLDIELKKQALVIASMRRHAGDVARAYYTGERATLLTLLFDTDNFNDFLMVVDFLQLLFEKDMGKLESFQAERAKAAKLLADKQDRLSKVVLVRQHFEQQLTKILAIQKAKEENLAKLSDPTAVQSLMDHLIADWNSRGLPAFHRFFNTLSNVMGQLPELLASDRERFDLLNGTVVIGEDEFNRFLASKDDIFKQSRFQFTDNQLIVDGSYDQMNLRVVGHYELVSPTVLKFHINQLLFDGFSLPDTTVQELENSYDLGFYPALIDPNIQVKSLTLDHQQLTLKLSYDLLGLLR